MKDMAGALAMLKKYEGCIAYMYLDTRGLVTVGVGFCLQSAEDAASYVFHLNQDLQKATPEQIKAEWTHLKSLEANHLERFYQPFTTMQMMPDDIDATLTQKALTYERVARQTFAAWDEFPVLAQLALLDMIYNLGSLMHYPRLVRYATNRDWAGCAQQCRRSGPGDVRNNETRDRFLAAAKEELAPVPVAGGPA